MQNEAGIIIQRNPPWKRTAIELELKHPKLRKPPDPDEFDAMMRKFSAEYDAQEHKTSIPELWDPFSDDESVSTADSAPNFFPEENEGDMNPLEELPEGWKDPFPTPNEGEEWCSPCTAHPQKLFFPAQPGTTDYELVDAVAWENEGATIQAITVTPDSMDPTDSQGRWAQFYCAFPATVAANMGDMSHLMDPLQDTV